MKTKREIINQVSENGRIFSVDFVKKNGELRTMACRLDVKKFLRGGENTTKHIEKYLTVFSVNDKGYRNVNLATITRVKGQGQEYTFKL
jgi:hypothetical protein